MAAAISPVVVFRSRMALLSSQRAPRSGGQKWAPTTCAGYLKKLEFQGQNGKNGQIMPPGRGAEKTATTPDGPDAASGGTALQGPRAAGLTVVLDAALQACTILQLPHVGPSVIPSKSGAPHGVLRPRRAGVPASGRCAADEVFGPAGHRAAQRVRLVGQRVVRHDNLKPLHWPVV